MGCPSPPAYAGPPPKGRGSQGKVIQRLAFDELGGDVEVAKMYAVVDDSGEDGEVEVFEELEFAPGALGGGGAGGGAAAV